MSYAMKKNSIKFFTSAAVFISIINLSLAQTPVPPGPPNPVPPGTPNPVQPTPSPNPTPPSPMPQVPSPYPVPPSPVPAPNQIPQDPTIPKLTIPASNAPTDSVFKPIDEKNKLKIE